MLEKLITLDWLWTLNIKGRSGIRELCVPPLFVCKQNPFFTALCSSSHGQPTEWCWNTNSHLTQPASVSTPCHTTSTATFPTPLINHLKFKHSDQPLGQPCFRTLVWIQVFIYIHAKCNCDMLICVIYVRHKCWNIQGWNSKKGTLSSYGQIWGCAVTNLHVYWPFVLNYEQEESWLGL